MHELSYVLDIIDSVSEVKNNDPDICIKKVVVEVGRMSGVVPYYLNKYFEEAKKDTFLAGAELETIDVEVKIRCEGCNKVYVPDKENRYKCPDCGERRGELLQGKGIVIKEVVVEES